MKQFICFFSGLLLLFVSTTRVVAQEVSDYSQLSEEDYTKIVLPPLSVLFENAKNSPIYEMADAMSPLIRTWHSPHTSPTPPRHKMATQ